jgi:hypothetical protein
MMHKLKQVWIFQSRDVIKDDFGGKLPSGRPFSPDVRGRRPDVRPRTRFSRTRDFTRERVSTVRRRGKNRVRADTSPSPPLSPPPLPSPLSLPPLCCPCGRKAMSARTRKNNNNK